MMIKLTYFLQVLLYSSILFCSCHYKSGTSYEKNTNGGVTKKTFDKSGNLVRNEELNVDSVPEGIFKEYKGGILRCSGQYKSGKKEGTWTYLNLIGDTIRIENWFSDRRVGEQIWYYERVKSADAQKVSSYGFRDYDGEQVFVAFFDASGQITKIEGIPFTCIYNKSNVSIGIPFELFITFGLPQTFKYDCIITETDSDHSKNISRVAYSDSSRSGVYELDYGKRVKIEKIYPTAGKYSWKIFFQLKNSAGTILNRDSMSVDVVVNK
ncbi:MAG: hypothetical protein ABJA78_11860 [Ferruginibacter sp.]